MSRYRRECVVLVAWLALLGCIALGTKSGGFFSAIQIRNSLVAVAPVLVVAIGMTLVILARQIDISVGAQVSVSGVTFGLLVREGTPMPLAVLVVIAIGIGFGALNGWLVAGLRLPSIVVTLATMVILRELLRYGREGEAVYGLPESFQWIGFDPATGPWVVVGISVGVFLLFAWGMRHIAAGRAVYATGSELEAAQLAGLRPATVTVGVFAVTGGLAGLAAVLTAIRSSTVDAELGKGLELQVIAAVVVGGTAVSGGRGTLFGTLLGVLLLGTISPALLFLGFPPQWEKAVQGVVILLAVVADALGRRGRTDD